MPSPSMLVIWKPDGEAVGKKEASGEHGGARENPAEIVLNSAMEVRCAPVWKSSQKRHDTLVGGGKAGVLALELGRQI